MASLLAQLLQETADRLLSDPFFSDVPVIRENQGDLANAIAIAIQSPGIRVVVALQSAAADHPDVFGPFFDDIQLQVDIEELPEINRGSAGTGKEALEVAEHVCNLLHHWTPDGLSKPLMSIKPSIIYEPPAATGFVSIHTLFRTAGGLTTVLPTIYTPLIGNAGGLITITCGTGGAAIFYTSNGSHPSPRAGTLYTVPFATPAPGTTIRARAWLAGYTTSLLASLAV